ncbi:MAG: bifunctional DNA-binding transcriptional regulator/O6-methylguanine-DNA methyltransferase Ada [Phycisphaerae bacterium]
MSTTPSSPISEQTAWQATLARNPAYDHRFVFAVLTTGIFCKPSCPAKRPLRKNVQFFTTPQSALKAGFRPCQRCEPHSPAGTRAHRAIHAAMSHLRQHPTQDFSLDALARQANLSKFHFLRLFKIIAGATPRAYQRAHRLHNLRTSLRINTPVTRALQQNRIAPRSQSLGMTPTQYRRRGSGTTIHFTTAPCSLGRILVATTTRGICAVLLGDTDQSLESELREEFPAATISRENPTLRPILRHLLKTIDKNHPFPASIPTAPQGTAFQLRVWHALRKILPGQTRTYTQLAKQINAPRATRAVANACAKNKIAILIPCHRAVRADQKPSGYRWGLPRKSALLHNETRRPAQRLRAPTTRRD